MVDKIPYVENLVNPFFKTQIGRVCVGDRDNIGFRWVSAMLYMYDALRASIRMLGYSL